jgi:hypothetical protein
VLLQQRVDQIVALCLLLLFGHLPLSQVITRTQTF